jgi:hypothetical protein
MRANKSKQMDKINNLVVKLDNKIKDKINDNDYVRERKDKDGYDYIRNGLFNSAAFQFKNTYPITPPNVVGP